MPDLTAADVRRIAAEIPETWDAQNGYCLSQDQARDIMSICRLALAVLEPEWRKEPPDEEGYWWVSDGNERDIGYVFGDSDGLIFRNMEDESYTPVSQIFDRWWCGPMNTPDDSRLRAENSELRGSKQ